MDRRADTSVPIHDLVAERWSPVGFDRSVIGDDDLAALFEAARWAPSSYNEQPWRFLVARRDDPEAFDAMLSCLVDANSAWAGNASALMLTAAVTTHVRNGKPNGKALHDLGLAVGNMSAEATARGLVMHQMGGILPDRARELYGVPDDAEVVTAIAVGRAAQPRSLPDDLRGRDEAPRARRPLADQVFGGAWGRSAPLGGRSGS
jgi:nitroreductase